MLAASVHADTVQTVSCRSLGTECPVTELHRQAVAQNFHDALRSVVS